MIALGLVLVLGLGPGLSTPPEDSEDDQAAWDAAGWGAPAEQPDEPGEALDEAPEDPDASAWGAAGWGDPPTTDDSPSEATAEGPEQPEPTSEDWTTWDQSSSSSGTSEEGESSKKERPKAGDILAGSLRLTGSFLHFYDQPQLPVTPPDDALALTVARFLVEADAGEHLHFSFNAFGELSRVPAGGSVGGIFTSAGATASAYRTDYLRWTFWDPDATRGESVAGQLGVDRAFMRLSFKSVNIDIGRFPITYTVASMFTVNDFFTPFAANAVNRIYKPGVDGARVSVGIGPTASFDVSGVLGYDAPPNRGTIPSEDETATSYYNGAPTWARSAVFAYASVVGGGFEWAAIGGKLSQRWVAGGSLQGDAGPINLRAEFHVGFPDEDGDGHDPDPSGDADKPIYGRVSGGPSVTFAWKNANIFAEYMFASDGALRPSAYIDRALDGFSDDLPYLGQHYVGLAGGSEIIPILRWGLTGLVNVRDGSGLVGVSLIYNVANESDLILGVFVPWGKPVTYFDLLTQDIELGSEFGLAPLSAYLEARVFF